MQRVRERVRAASRIAGSVLVIGETGTGKELVARAIHEHSDRSNGRFVPVDCGALPDELIESELFGHRRGAFTSAMTDKTGLFEEANGGTLFLDEIANTSRRFKPSCCGCFRTDSFGGLVTSYRDGLTYG